MILSDIGDNFEVLIISSLKYSIGTKGNASLQKATKDSYNFQNKLSVFFLLTKSYLSMQVSSSSQLSVVVITSPQLQHLGHYACTATNILGQDAKTVHLKGGLLALFSTFTS